MAPKNQKGGITLIEIFIVVIFILVVVLGVGGVLKGNYWFTEGGVLRELQLDYPDVSEILKTNRNVLARSVITIENADGSRSEYLLDANILFDYGFELAEE